jgi:hypothetical protein
LGFAFDQKTADFALIDVQCIFGRWPFLHRASADTWEEEFDNLNEWLKELNCEYKIR